MSPIQSSCSNPRKVSNDITIPFPTSPSRPTERPTHQTNFLHLPLIPPLRLPRITLPKLTRRHTEPNNLKIKCSSGPSKKTHSTLSTCTNQRRCIIQHHDIFICSDAVNAPRLVALTREAMDVQIQFCGGNAMVDESWSYTIQQRKSSQGSCFKVSVKYTGVVAQCDRPDPHYPVALEVAKSIPGLMTVISRE